MRTILHSDCNSFYASVELVYNPALRDKPVAVCGDPSERHGIVLAKSDAAKQCGIRTGEAVWEARQKCPDLIVLRPDGEKYLRFSRMMRAIYADYTDCIEPFGLDESWLDTTGSRLDGVEIASRIRRRAREELGITVSVGVSFNKVFAKLGSDMHKPDATTVITRENYRRKLWPLPVGELLYIGRATSRKLLGYGISTIGDIARANPDALRSLLGKCGDTLYTYATGGDETPVRALDATDDIKSIGNSTTPSFDIDCLDDARRILYLLSDSVAARLRHHQLLCKTVTLWIRHADLTGFERQMKPAFPADLSGDIAACALRLLRDNWDGRRPLRSLGVRGCDLLPARRDEQLTVFPRPGYARQAALERALDDIRARFGYESLQRGVLFTRRNALNPNACDNIAAANFSAIRGR